MTDMLLHITPARLISEVQKDFNREFPYLKLEFFKKKLPGQAGFSASGLLAGHQKLGMAWPGLKDGDIDIKPDMKVKELENTFRDDFSIRAQVFRLSGNIWLETTMTDNWTLRQQNEHGREISAEKKVKKEGGADDYELTRDADH